MEEFPMLATISSLFYHIQADGTWNYLISYNYYQTQLITAEAEDSNFSIRFFKLISQAYKSVAICKIAHISV